MIWVELLWKSGETNVAKGKPNLKLTLRGIVKFNKQIPIVFKCNMLCIFYFIFEIFYIIWWNRFIFIFYRCFVKYLMIESCFVSCSIESIKYILPCFRAYKCLVIFLYIFVNIVVYEAIRNV